MNQYLLIQLINIILLIIILLSILYVYVPRQQRKNAAKQKAKEDREKKEQYDFILNEYPTISRYTTDASFLEMELTGTTGPIIPMDN